MLRTCVICCALAGVAGLTAGCNNTKDPKPAPAKKDEAVAAYKTQLGALDKQVDELKAKGEKAAGDDKVRLEARLKDAGAKRDAAQKKLDELARAAADKWEAANKDAAAALEDLKKAVKE
ncbi:MAG: hypothetical protein ACKODX_19935 [Gemmata sp.]